MSANRLISPIIAIYIVAMMLFWFHGDGTDGWNTFYYSIEKLFASIGFILLALESKSRYIVHVSLFGSAICLFMFLYFIYCMHFGHDSRYAVGALLLYSIVSVSLIKKVA